MFIFSTLLICLGDWVCLPSLASHNQLSFHMTPVRNPFFWHITNLLVLVTVRFVEKKTWLLASGKRLLTISVQRNQWSHTHFVFQWSFLFLFLHSTIGYKACFQRKWRKRRMGGGREKDPYEKWKDLQKIAVSGECFRMSVCQPYFIIHSSYFSSQVHLYDKQISIDGIRTSPNRRPKSHSS